MYNILKNEISTPVRFTGKRKPLGSDKYKNFKELSKSEVEGKDYKIVSKQKNNNFLFVAPHGGNIEPGTSEIVKALSKNIFSYYLFEGTKVKEMHNVVLHLTSSHFDEPKLTKMLLRSNTTITIHGYGWDNKSEAVIVGGLDYILIKKIKFNFKKYGFKIKNSKIFRGDNKKNICNKGISQKGVQLEINRILRRNLIKDKNKMKMFVESIYEAIK